MKELKYIKLFETVSNLSKIRKWDTRLHKKTPYSDLYFIYDLNKKEIGKYLNTWFTGVTAKTKDGKHTRNEIITVKKVDDDTKQQLYQRKFNPVTITIMCPTGAKFKQDENGDDLYEMKAQIHSIDDSSFGVWWSNYYGSELSFEKLDKIREKLCYG